MWQILPSLKTQKLMPIKLRLHSLQHQEVAKCFTWTLTTQSIPSKPNKMVKRWNWTKTTQTWWWLRPYISTISSLNSRRIRHRPSQSIAPRKTLCFLPLTRDLLWWAQGTPILRCSMDSDSMCKKTRLSTLATARQCGRSMASQCAGSERLCRSLPIEGTRSLCCLGTHASLATTRSPVMEYHWW